MNVEGEVVEVEKEVVVFEYDVKEVEEVGVEVVLVIKEGFMEVDK